MQSPAVADIVVDELPPARPSLRIALVTETYPPEVNGVALTLARMAEGLRARQHAVQLVRLAQTASEATAARNGPAARDEVLLRGIQIPRYPHLKMGVPCTQALVSLWTRQRPDVVHIATEGPLGWSALRAARRLKLPVVSDFRTNFQAYSRHYGIGWLQRPIVAYLRKFHNLTQCTMVPTQALRRDLQLQGFERVEVVARGVDTQLFTPARHSDALRSSWGVSPTTLVVLCVGRLAPEKNLPTLRLAFERLRESVPDARLVLVGDGPQRLELCTAWPDVCFAGVQRGEALAAHYASADLFVFPSLTETFGNVVPEAMASGLPVVAYRHAAAAELIRDGVDGCLAPAGDDAAFVARVCEAARDQALRQRLAREARESACRNDWERVIDDLERVLVTAVPRRHSGARPLLLRPIAG